MRILIVEDEKRIQDFLSRGLESAGYAVDVAGDGRHRDGAGPRHRVRPDHSGPDAARHRRLGAAPEDPQPQGQSARADPQRARCRGRSRQGPRARRGRLSHQALRLRRSCWPECVSCCAAASPLRSASRWATSPSTAYAAASTRANENIEPRSQGIQHSRIHDGATADARSAAP